MAFRSGVFSTKSWFCSWKKHIDQNSVSSRLFLGAGLEPWPPETLKTEPLWQEGCGVSQAGRLHKGLLGGHECLVSPKETPRMLTGDDSGKHPVPTPGHVRMCFAKALRGESRLWSVHPEKMLGCWLVIAGAPGRRPEE